VRLGISIQKGVWTMSSLSSQSPSILWVCNHCLLKTTNEAVVKGMCKVVGKQANKGKGLGFVRYVMREFYYGCRCIFMFSDSLSCFRARRYANEARISWNDPLQHEVDDFLKKSLDHHFMGGKWHFYSIDPNNRPLVSITSMVIDRLGKKLFKLSFMK